MLAKYLASLQTELSTGNALEHTYRPALKILIESLDESINAVNEPTRSAHGAPDYIFLNKNNKDLILGYAETKDLNVDLDEVEKSEQLKRYLGYPNLILTNYLEFRFFRNGEKYQTVTIAELKFGVIQDLNINFLLLEREIKAFLSSKPEILKSAEKLAKIMGGKALRIRENVQRFLTGERDAKNHELFRLYEVMKQLLVHDMEIDKFADMYAQTLVYGLFVARYYDESPEGFSRAEARDLVPASNPFLREFFDHIAGASFDARLKYIADELCAVFAVSDISDIMKRKYNLFGETVDKDPIIHFYEDFLFEYDPLLKKQMGAYYTPVPVVRFIVRAVDEVLKKDFNLIGGVADTTKVEVTEEIQNSKRKRKIPRVQILDPAVGTATFLNEIIKFIYLQFHDQKGMWPSYVDTELLPRLNGFELMMAPYIIAHLKLALTLKETNIDEFKQRLRVYLTNTLEEGIKNNPGLFDFSLVGAITKESEEASRVKHSTPVMVVMGNPPYSGESFNKGEYAMKLVDKYKFEPGGRIKLKERNPKWINDDYVKFIAFATDLIDKTGEGIVAMITNHGYIENPTFRGMRWQLTNTFSTLYILDLHGNAKKKEIAADGSSDQNIFDIQQGVSIMIGVKKKSKGTGATVLKADLQGSRRIKFDWLNSNSINSIKWEKIRLRAPSYVFVNKDEKLQNEYESGIKLNELFPLNNVGIVTSRDGFVIDVDKDKLYSRIASFCMSDPQDPRLLTIVKQSPNFQFSKAIAQGFDESNLHKVYYRPFDWRYIYFTEYYIERQRKDVMSQMLHEDNIALGFSRGVTGSYSWQDIQVVKGLTEFGYMATRVGNGAPVAPLYIYDGVGQTSIDVKKRVNLDSKLVSKLLTNIVNKSTIQPENIFDYIYASLYSPKYREKYQVFLKSDFPRVPLARDDKSFWNLVALGAKLRKLHLLDEHELEELTTTFPEPGSDVVEAITYKDARVYINSVQYFDNISKDIFNFYIGGYQPAQRWLKDRKGKRLVSEDIIHYERIISSLSGTIKIMSEIDSV